MKGHWFALGEPQDEPVSSELTGKGVPQEAAKGTEAGRCQARCRGCQSGTTRVLSYSPGMAAGIGVSYRRTRSWWAGREGARRRREGRGAGESGAGGGRKEMAGQRGSCADGRETPRRAKPFWVRPATSPVRNLGSKGRAGKSLEGCCREGAGGSPRKMNKRSRRRSC